MTWVDGVVVLVGAMGWFGVVVWTIAKRPSARLEWSVHSVGLGLAVGACLHRAGGVAPIGSLCGGLIAGPLISALWQLKRRNLGWEMRFLDKQQARPTRRTPPRPRDD